MLCRNFTHFGHNFHELLNPPRRPYPSELDSLSPAQLAILIRHANDRAETVRQQIGEENWDRFLMVPPAPNESG